MEFLASTKRLVKKIKKALKGKSMRSFLLGFDRFLSKKWYLSATLVVGIDVALSLGLHFSEALGLATENGRSLTPLGRIVYCLSIAASFLIVLANSYAAHCKQTICLNDSNSKEYDDDIANYDAVLEGLSYVNSECVSDLIETMCSASANAYDYPQVLTNPAEHLRILSEKLASTIATLFSVRSHRVKPIDVHSSIHYCFPNLDDSWHIAKGHEQYDGLSTQELLQEGTTFYEVLHSSNGFKFYNSKAEAKSNKHYVVDNKDVLDKDGKPLGSIACYKIELIDNNRVVYVRAVVSISTRTKPFLKKASADDLRNVEYNLKAKVFYEFAKQIAVELALLYIKKTSCSAPQKIAVGAGAK